ncbi:MAG: hypothetical protein E4H14_16835 [Candidatus Thorarchaeota archaeon]|nr:MAG: hypothetical protein E4H14_16835 [Candidatus Thorarchaeota archaeon]
MRYGRRYPGNGPWSDVPPYQRLDREAGYGRGAGLGYGFAGIDPTKCARFPWRSRWWWSNPDVPAPTGFEKEFLEGQVTTLSKELESLKKKLSELPPEETQ